MIFGCVFFVISFFSFLIIKIQLHGSERKVLLMINEQKQKFLAIDNINKKHSKLINMALGNVYAAIVRLLDPLTQKFEYSVVAAFYHHSKDETGTGSRTCIINANSYLDDIIKSVPLKDQLIASTNLIGLLSKIKSLSNSDVEAMSIVAVEILNKINNLKK